MNNQVFKRMSTHVRLAVGVSLVFLMAGPLMASGTIVLVSSNYVFDAVASSNGIRTITSAQLGGFDANGADKLVVTIGGKGTSNNVIAVSYGGTAMSQAVEAWTGGAAGGNGGEIWYLDNVTNNGDFVVTFDVGQAGIGFGVYKLQGTLPGFTQAVGCSYNTYTEAYTNAMQMTTTIPGELVIAGMARNNTPNPFGAVAPLVDLFKLGDGVLKFSVASAFGFIESPGGILPVIDQITNGVGSTFAVRFQPYIAPKGTVVLIR
jgi:hypothetical protein